MNQDAIIFLLSLTVALLAGVIFYQRYAFHAGTMKSLRKLNSDLQKITGTNGGGQVMVFTENKELMELAAQINRLLESQAKAAADCKRREAAYKRMLSNISHDIKTPMTVILGYLEILQTNRTDMDNMLKKAEKKANEVCALINQFFTLAKLDAGDMDMELSKIDVCEICRESVLEFYEILSQRDFDVEIQIPAGPVFILGNKDGLQRILSNLISNAVRYGADGKYLGLAVRAEDHAVSIDVTDRGKGIDMAFSESVFDRLFTMEDSRSRKVQGNGLGLTIAKSLAEHLGGTISLTSTPHVKTTFTVTFPALSHA